MANLANIVNNIVSDSGVELSSLQPVDADLTAIAGLAETSGFLKKTAANTWSLDTNTYLTGITSGQVTTALGYTPYNATNPSGYITSSGNISGYAMSLNGFSQQVEYTILTGPANGPVWKVRYDGATANRYIDFGFKDGNNVYYEGFKIYNNGTPTWAGNTILHAGNVGSYSLPIGGGTLLGNVSYDGYALATSSANTAHILGNWNGAGYWGMGSNGTHTIRIDQVGSLSGPQGFQSVNDVQLDLGTNRVLHAGNYSSYALPLTGGSLSGPLTITGNGSYLGDWGYNTLTLIDTSGYSGIAFKYGNDVWLTRRSTSGTMDWAYSTDASAQGTGTYTQKMMLSSNEWWVSTYPGYKMKITGGDVIDVVNGSGATTLYLQYQGTAGGAVNIAAGKYTLDNSGNGSASSSWRAPIFYDSNDTAYYCDPNSTSRLYTVSSFYLRNNYDVSTDHAYGIYFNNNNTDQSYAIFRENGGWSHPYPDLRIAFHTGIKLGAYYGYNGIRFYNNSDMVTITASVNDGDNNFRGYYDIIAYASDKRLKYNVKPIENAVSKVMSLTGMTYEWNDIASKHGWEPGKEREAGVFAQDVQAVLPEAVRPAPFDHAHDEDGNAYSKSGENFLTVKYEKLVPLLIEGMKEQQSQIEDQKSEIAELKDLVKQLLSK